MKISSSIVLSFIVLFGEEFYFGDASPVIGPNAVNAGPTEFPYVVALVYYLPSNPNPETNQLCTGALITRKDVATSAHCVMHRDINTVQIHYGSIDLRLGHKHHIYWWLTYENWSLHQNIIPEYDINDVANIRLLVPVHVFIIPVPIANIPESNLYDHGLVIVGWSWENDLINPHLTRANVIALSTEECLQRVSRHSTEFIPVVAGHSLCTMSSPHSLLHAGDSGGPLLYRNQLVGINKGVTPDNLELDDPNLVNYHMSMQYYREFFEDIKNWYAF